MFSAEWQIITSGRPRTGPSYSESTIGGWPTTTSRSTTPASIARTADTRLTRGPRSGADVVGEVEAGGRLVEDVDAALLSHVGGQLEPLPLAAGQRSERLAEAEVAEPDVGEPVEDSVRGRRARLAGAEELLGLGHRHREHLADVAAAEVVFQHRCLEPLALAVLAGGGDPGHHRQVGVDEAGAVAVGAGPL